MVGAVREITINQGIDPRESIVVAGGGAGGLTMSKIAEELGCDKVLVPQTAAALSATGGLLGDVVAEFTVSRRADTNALRLRRASTRGSAELDRQIDGVLRRAWTSRRRRACRTTSSRRATRTRSGSSRWPCPAGASRARPTSTRSWRRSTRRTSASSRSRSPASASSACTGRAARACTCPSRPLAAAAGDAAGAAERRAAPDVVGRGRRRSRRRVYLGAGVSRASAIAGPAIVEVPTTTVVVYPGLVRRP